MSFCKGRFEDFCSSIGSSQYKPAQKWLRQMLFGILRRQSVLLSEIGRALNEDTPLAYTEKRLSRHLCSTRFDDRGLEKDYLNFMGNILREYRAPIISVDQSDIAKPYASKMPYLASIRDASTGLPASGYNYVSIEAQTDGDRRMPLMTRLYSSAHPQYRSEHKEILKAIEPVRKQAPEDAIWVFDRGFDSRRWTQQWDEMNINWVLRLRSHEAVGRVLFMENQRKRVHEIADEILPSSAIRIERFSPKAKKLWLVRVGWRTNLQPLLYTKAGTAYKHNESKKNYSMLVVKGPHDHPLVLLTNMNIESKTDAAKIANAYYCRWIIEEQHRFLKTQFDLENLRALTWQGISRLILLAAMAYGFLSFLVYEDEDSIRHVAASFKSFGPVPKYIFYRLIEGIGYELEGIQKSGP